MPYKTKLDVFQGLASIMLLVPVLVFFYWFNAKTFPEEYALPFAMPYKEPPVLNGHNKVLCYGSENIIRQYDTFIITGNKQSDILQLQRAASSIAEVAASNDTIIGTRIVFEENAKYREFIKALDICYNTHGNILWTLEDNELMVCVYSCPPDEPLPVSNIQPIFL